MARYADSLIPRRLSHTFNTGYAHSEQRESFPIAILELRTGTNECMNLHCRTPVGHSSKSPPWRECWSNHILWRWRVIITNWVLTAMFHISSRYLGLGLVLFRVHQTALENWLYDHRHLSVTGPSSPLADLGGRGGSWPPRLPCKIILDVLEKQKIGK